MPKHNAANERIKREYFSFLEHAKGRDMATIDRVAKSLARFEEATARRDFKKFHRAQAMAFKKRLGETLNARTGERLSKATVQSVLRDLKDFFEWLAREPGYRSKIQFSDADFFNMSEKDVAIARAQREKPVPTAAQVERVLEALPAGTVLERRNRALVAFAALTAARVDALRTIQLGHVDLDEGFVDQDARQVRTKFSKSFRTYFMPVIERADAIVRDWIVELQRDHLWGPCDPLFPATEMGLDKKGSFQPIGVARRGWHSTGPIRDIFRKAFEAAGLPYYNPHSFRDMLVRHAMSLDLTPEQMKAWSQNLGHEQVLTTFTSYGKVPVHRQGELIRMISDPCPSGSDPISALETALSVLKTKAAGAR